MADVRFIRKDGQRVDTAIVRKQFFESAIAANASPERICRIWNAAIFGDPSARDVIEDVCDIGIVDSDVGFGFLE